jgi:hypothetical protein
LFGHGSRHSREKSAALFRAINTRKGSIGTVIKPLDYQEKGDQGEDFEHNP